MSDACWVQPVNVSVSSGKFPRNPRRCVSRDIITLRCLVFAGLAETPTAETIPVLGTTKVPACPMTHQGPSQHSCQGPGRLRLTGQMTLNGRPDENRGLSGDTTLSPVPMAGLALLCLRKGQCPEAG
ncbi:hypothetical protein AAFF_G00100980 [Aldrovandia affinis]|uniref:Uncharacterized protein n=1 Tax=Aldrovandia affinis TaxID=143900 RepID=A0AAD7WBM4_9TELE|nr:hypothetical protein AAFF_G00100980 [Aldrovandia affinis]